MKLALNIIVKDEVEQVKRIISEYGKYFDEICIAVDEKAEEFKAIQCDKLKVFSYQWRDDFAHKRNFLAENTESQYYLRIDTDDGIENPENIAEVVKVMVDNNIDVVYCPYIYSLDPNGIPDAEHWRETIIKKKNGVYWKKAVHENVFIEDQSDYRALKCDKIKILHDTDDDHHKKSTERNLRLLLKEFEQDGNDTDPRTLSYLGRMYYGLGQFEKAIKFLEILTQRSGWDDDKYFAWIHLAECWKHFGNYDYAIAACNEALAINTKFPDAYLELGSLYLQKQDYQKALDWLMPGLVRPKPDTMFVIDSTVYSWKARANVALAYFGNKDIDNAMKFFLSAKKIAPNEPALLKIEPVITEAYYSSEYFKRLLWMIKMLEDKDKDKIPVLLRSIPKQMMRDERVHLLRHKYETPVKWPDNSIAIFCGSTVEPWSPVNVEQGIGGSEEAVIYLSRELVKQGYQVTVFNECGEMAGNYDGVEYRNFFEFNPNDTYDIVIMWRQNIFGELKLDARKKIVWLHDMPYQSQFTPNRIDPIDSIVVLSQYHKSLLPEHAQNKAYVSTNGINEEDFKGLEIIEREPYRVIYASSYDRGLEQLLKCWKKVKEEVPDAELHIFYGWDTFDKMMNMGYRDVADKQKVVSLMSQPGVFDHGRVGHKQLLKEYARSSVFAYPTNFAGEINCIALTKAIACGCKDVTNDRYVLGERGTNPVPDDKFADRLIEVLKDKTVGAVDCCYISANSWEQVAKDWKKDIL